MTYNEDEYSLLFALWHQVFVFLHAVQSKLNDFFKTSIWTILETQTDINSQSYRGLGVTFMMKHSSLPRTEAYCQMELAQSTGAVEYTNCISAEK